MHKFMHTPNEFLAALIRPLYSAFRNSWPQYKKYDLHATHVNTISLITDWTVYMEKCRSCGQSIQRTEGFIFFV